MYQIGVIFITIGILAVIVTLTIAWLVDAYDKWKKDK